jgi:hypothetical protein
VGALAAALLVLALPLAVISGRTGIRPVAPATSERATPSSGDLPAPERTDLSLASAPAAAPAVEAGTTNAPDSAAADAMRGHGEGQAARTPWSGWWWPDTSVLGPTLFAVAGPLDKYDRLVRERGGSDPRTRSWEDQHMRFNLRWAGHCNGYATAALLEPEPTRSITLDGIQFTVADQKGLLADYPFADSTLWSVGQDGELNPADFHRVLLEWLGQRATGMVLTFDMGGGEFWSFPAYRFSSDWSRDARASEEWRVRTTIWMADMSVAADFVGTRPYPGEAGKTFEYTLRGDPRDPVDGTWLNASVRGGLDRPARAWYPDPLARNVGQQLTSPGLDRRILATIAGGR